MVLNATHGAEVLLILVLVAHPQLLQQIYRQRGGTGEDKRCCEMHISLLCKSCSGVCSLSSTEMQSDTQT